MKISGAALSQVDRGNNLYKRLVGVHRQIAEKDPSTWGPAAAAEAAVGLAILVLVYRNTRSTDVSFLDQLKG